MQSQEKNFLIVAAFFLLFGIIAFSNEALLKTAHSITQYYIAGNSNGKLILSIAWLSIIPLLCFIALKTRLSRRIEKKHKAFFKAFIIISIITFSAGIAQFFYFSSMFNNGTYFATFLKEENYNNWEASKISHTHFPKISVHFLEKNLGFKLGGQFDDGKPFYNIFPNPDYWSVLFIVLVSLMIVFLLLHFFSRSEKISVFDFLLLSLASLSLFVHSFDGGIATGTSIFGIFFLTTYAFRNYSGIENGSIKNLAPLAIASMIAVVILYISDVLSAGFSVPLLLTLGLGYYFAKTFLEGKLKKNIQNIALFAVFIISINGTLIAANILFEGQWVLDFSKEPAKTGQKADNLFIYGIPESLQKSELESQISEFGEIIELEKQGWVAFVRIVPFKAFRTGRLEEKLIKNLKPKGYLYVEEILPKTSITEYNLYLLKNEQPLKFGSKFLGIEVLKQERSSETNSIFLTVKSDYSGPWEMLAILTEAQKKGLKKQALLVKN